MNDRRQHLEVVSPGGTVLLANGHALDRRNLRKGPEDRRTLKDRRVRERRQQKARASAPHRRFSEERRSGADRRGRG